MSDTSEPNSLQTPTDASDGARSAAPDRDATILQLYAEIARYAVQLATNRIDVTMVCGEARSSCEICLNVAEPDAVVVHDDSCMIGRTFAIATEIAVLNAAPAERSIEYFGGTTEDGEPRVACTLTHEQAATFWQGPKA